MKLVTKLGVFVLIGLFAAYHIYFFLLPSVTVTNSSGKTLERVNVVLPDSSLDFGPLEAGGQNTLYYALQQKDGQYAYQISLHGSFTLSGICGYVTSNELHKRVQIEVFADKVSCD